MVEENNMITDANAAAERLEKANAIQAEQIRQLREIETRKILGGQSSASEPVPVKIETPTEYAHRMLRGGK